MITQHHRHASVKPLLIVAGAGTGKTTAIINRIIEDVAHILPEAIVVTTFTNRATRTLIERLKDRIGVKASKIRVNTMHKLAFQMLKPYACHLGYTQQIQCITRSAQNKFFTSLNVREDINELIAIFYKYKENLIKFSSLSETQSSLYNKYNEYLLNNSLVDVSDIIPLLLKLWHNYPNILEEAQKQIASIYVDEFQDINHQNYDLIKTLYDSRLHKIICVGDPNQSIYAFRGGKIQYIKQFSRYFAEAQVMKLTMNYRSTSAIVNSANNLINNNKDSAGVIMEAYNNHDIQKVKTIIAQNDIDEMRLVMSSIKKIQSQTSQSIAILVRTTNSVALYEKACLAHDIYYSQSSNTATPQERQIIYAYIKFLSNHSDQDAFKYILTNPKRNIGDATIKKIINYANGNQCNLLEAMTQINASAKIMAQLDAAYLVLSKIAKLTPTLSPYHLIKLLIAEANISKIWNANEQQHILSWLLEIKQYNKTLIECLNSMPRNECKRVNILTIHSAKGLEFDAVFLPEWRDGNIPHSKSKTHEEIEEERRIAYVAITRAKQQVTISASHTMLIQNSLIQCTISPFINELKLDVQEDKHTNFSIGTSIVHKKYGRGLIEDQSEEYVKVKFTDDTVKVMHINDCIIFRLLYASIISGIKSST